MAASKFDYLNEYCKVVYLERTQGVSSTEIREGCCLLKIESRCTYRVALLMGI